jgi:copper chaperone
MTTIEYRVSGMTCGHCEQAVRGEVDKIEGLTVSSVDAGRGLLLVESASDAIDDAVLAAVDEAGYEAARA